MDDTISRQAAIDKVWNITKIVPTMAIRAKDALETIPSAQPDVARDIATIIENEKDMRVMLASQQGQRWIPVSERLPEESGRYIISVLDGAWRRTTVAPYQPSYKAWTMTGRMTYWKVVAWMPLPEPYKEEE